MALLRARLALIRRARLLLCVMAARLSRTRLPLAMRSHAIRPGDALFEHTRRGLCVKGALLCSMGTLLRLRGALLRSMDAILDETKHLMLARSGPARHKMASVVAMTAPDRPMRHLLDSKPLPLTHVPADKQRVGALVAAARGEALSLNDSRNVPARLVSRCSKTNFHQ